jgi:L,D-transpeptidase catalytic domain
MVNYFYFTAKKITNCSLFSSIGLIVVLLNSCELFSPSPPPRPPAKAHHVMYEWFDNGSSSDVSIHINLTEQKARIKRGSENIGWTYIATGKEGRATPAGKYSVMEKIVDKYSNKYGWIEDANGRVVNDDATPSSSTGPGETYKPAPMFYWHRITAYGIGMHIGSIPKPGEPASHGCIRMPKEFAPILYSVTKVGTPVTIAY